MSNPDDSRSVRVAAETDWAQWLLTAAELARPSHGAGALEAWFLGTKGENGDVLERMIVEAIRDHVYWRRNYQPADPGHITERIRRAPEYTEALSTLLDEYRSLLAFLKKSVPFFSMRYQGHMIWDLTLPSLAGYFAAMLYNPNNVAFEASPTTTILEMLVGDDLCRMLGYTIPDEDQRRAGARRPWGHITCDGTVANIEALWSARNLKFYPAALKRALATEEPLWAARDIDVPIATGGSAKLVEMDTWSLLNLRADDILALPARISARYGVAAPVLSAAMSAHHVQNVGIQRFARDYLEGVNEDPVFLVPGTKHYSLSKAAALLGLGASNIMNVSVDLDARMDVGHLRELLRECLRARRPVLTVVAVLGSTEESSVDPLRAILDLREELRAAGLDFTIHVDAAWGGYHASVLREGDSPMPDPMGGARGEAGDTSEDGAAPVELPASAERVPTVALNAHVERQFRALPGADSITVDPHKSGYIPFPAGALCYRNAAMRELVTFDAPYLGGGGPVPSMGIYGVEGSKPGAAAASVYLSHRVIRPNKHGYGAIIGEALFSCKKLYARLLTMATAEDPFVVVPLPRLPAEKEGKGGPEVDAQIALIRDRIARRDNQKLLHDPEVMALLREIGPDQNILCYAFNWRCPDGSLNASLEMANELNEMMYARLSPKQGSDIYAYRLIVSTTVIDEAHYGRAFVDDYKRRLGVGGSPGGAVRVLRSTVMDPWVTETTKGSFLHILEEELRAAFVAAFAAMSRAS